MTIFDKNKYMKCMENANESKKRIKLRKEIILLFGVEYKKRSKNIYKNRRRNINRKKETREQEKL